MTMLRSLSLLIAPLFVAIASGQPATVPATLRMEDGSGVRVALETDAVEIQTKYGVLKIPLADVRTIDFAFRQTPELVTQIEVLISALGAGEFKIRDKAQADLVTLGRQAVRHLHRAAVSKDLEVARRAGHALDKIKKALGELPGLRTDDSISTAEATYTGNLLTTVIKAESKTFGKIEVKIADLKSLRMGAADEVSLDLNAEFFGDAPGKWVDTGVDSQGQLKILASGTVDLWPQGPGQYLCGPGGHSVIGRNSVHMAGALVAKIGADGESFQVRESKLVEAATLGTGRLYLAIIPSQWGGASSGSYRVRIKLNE